jgi:cephalosporin hydroxylase
MAMRAKYKGFTLVHEQEALPNIIQVIRDFGPELMIEFGTSWGGFTMVMHSVNRTTELHTYDIPKSRRKVEGKEQFSKHVYFHLQDILTEEVEEIVDLCKDERKKFLYCDNGDKPKEILMYGSKLNAGDLLGVHDWYSEVKPYYDTIKEVMEGFDPHPMNEKFEKNGWSSRFFIKK